MAGAATSESTPTQNGTVSDVLGHRVGHVVTVPEDVGLAEVVGLMRLHGISQIPVVRGVQVVGILTDAHLLDAVVQSGARTAGELADPSFAVVSPDMDVRAAAARLHQAGSALVLDASGAPVAVLSPIDLLDHLLRAEALGG